MFNNCFLTFREKLTLFFFQFRPRKKVKCEKSKTVKSLIHEYGFLEFFSNQNAPAIVRITDKGKKYIRYRREKRFDALLVPLVVSVAASIVTAFITSRII